MTDKCSMCMQFGIPLNNHATCSACSAAFPLCDNCKLPWKSKQCPKCGTYQANWKGI